MGLLSTGRIDCDSLAGMSKTVRSWDVDKAWLLPPSIHDLVPAGSAFQLALLPPSIHDLVPAGSAFQLALMMVVRALPLFLFGTLSGAVA